MTSIRRRTLLRLAGAGLAATTLPACAPTSGYVGPARPVRVAAGEPGGFYSAFARLLATEVAAAEPRLRMSVTGSEGSVANVELLRDGTAELALLLSDTAESAQRGAPDLGPPMPLRALGRVYENYMQAVVPASSSIRTLRDLAGQTVSLGAPKSGTAYFASRLLVHSGLRPGIELHAVTPPLEQGVAALESGTIGALFFSGGVPTPALNELDDRIGIRLLPLDATLPGLSTRNSSAIEQVSIPPGAYRHTGEVPTVGMANLLVCTPELPPDVAATIVRVLVRRAAHLVPQQAVGTQFLDVRTLIGTGSIPLHEGARTTYRELHG